LTTRAQKSTLRRLTTIPSPSTDFSSNDYLSLSTSPHLRAAYLALLTNTPAPAFSLGSSGSRLLDGNSEHTEALETSIAAFHRAPAGLLFNSGFEANVGVFATLPQRGDVVVFDELVHASAHDGMRLSRAGRRVPFAHNCVASLASVLDALIREDERVRNGTRNVFVAVEAVYSMDGDVAPLEQMVGVVEGLLKGNGHFVVDEAHATGLVGERGRGLVCELGLEERVFARVHTFGKAMGCAGAIVLCAPLTREYLVNYARTLIYTTAMAFPSLASIRVVYDFMSAGGTEPLLTHLTHLTHHLHTLLLPLCPPGPSSSIRPLLALPPFPPRTPILPLLTPHPRSLAAHCQAAGYVVRAIVAPTVPKGRERVRVCLHAGNTVGEVEGLVRAVEGWL
ncbi:PLP-dependent transferase, partial [Saccharata proteae CBS 121410]